MTRQDLLKELDSLLDLPEGTLHGPEALEDLEAWDSMAVIGFVSLADSAGVSGLSAKQIGNCANVDDLLTLAKVD